MFAAARIRRARGMTPLGKAALALAGKGMRVFPCVERGKEPAIHNSFKSATTDPNIISGWWRRFDLNIAIATGPNSGIWVLDVDDDEGEATLRKLEAAFGPLPPTVEAITGNGRHLYWRWPTGIEIRNTQCRDDMPGLDVRGDGGYVMAPPSIHPAGRAYAWSVDSTDQFADAPGWLIDLVTRKRRGANKPAATPETWRTFIGEAVEGSRRGNAIARLSGLLLRCGPTIDPLVSLDICRMFNTLRCQPPLPDDEIVDIVTAICNRELQRRGLASKEEEVR
jgi:hypothetical protein